MSFATAPTLGAFRCPRCLHPRQEALLGPLPSHRSLPPGWQHDPLEAIAASPLPRCPVGQGAGAPRGPPRAAPFGSRQHPAPPARCGVAALGVPRGGPDPGLPGRWAMAELLLRLACRAASEISHRRCCGNGGKKPIFSQPFASLAGNALGARGGHAQPTAPVGGGRVGDTIPDPQIPLRGLESCGTPKGTGLCQGIPKTDPRRAGCPPAAKNPKNSRS